MSIRIHRRVKFGDVLCNQDNGRFYVIMGQGVNLRGKRKPFLTCIEASMKNEILHEMPISFDKDTVSKMSFVSNVATAALQRIQEKALKFDHASPGIANFRCLKPL